MLPLPLPMNRTTSGVTTTRARLGARGPLPHEPLGPAIRRGPLVRGVDALVVDLAHHALLIFRRQQRQQGRDLVGARVVPDPPSVRSVLPVHAVPSGHRFVGMPGRSASGFRVGQQRLVVLLRALETDTGSRCSREANPSCSLPSGPRPADCSRFAGRPCSSRRRRCAYRQSAAGHCSASSADPSRARDPCRNPCS